MEVGEACALGMKAVEIRRLQIWVPRAREITHPLVVGNDKNDIRPTSRKRLGLGPETQTYNGEHEERGEFYHRAG
jgi:hypothetical protein